MELPTWRQEQPAIALLAYHHVLPRAQVTLLVVLSVGWALTWLLWRAYQVIQTPNEILVEKLGLDIPSTPELILEGILAHEIQVAWKQAELPNSIHKHIVHVNGKQVGETKRTEIAVAIIGLAPHTLYEVRVFTVSAAGFQTPSQALFVRTAGLQKGNSENESDTSTPTIRVLHTKPAAIVPAVLAPTNARETSSAQLQNRRLAGGRMQSSAGLPLDPCSTANADESSRSLSEDEDDFDFARLQERFQKVQHENEVAESQILQEEEEFESAIKQLEARRDGLRQGLKERDEASADLRRQVHKLESASRAAQSERSKKEKLLDQKEGQRKKRREEMDKWEVQITSMTEEIAGIETQKVALKKRTASSIAELQQNVREEQAEARAIEEVNKEKVAQIKALEEERERLNVHEETDESREADREQWERDRQWQEMIYSLNAKYASLAHSVSHANMEFDVVRERLAFLQRAQQANMQLAYPPASPLDVDAFRQGIKQRRSRPKSSLSTSISSSSGAFPNLDAFTSPPLPYNKPANVSPTFASGTSFFSSTNGMTLMGPPDSIEAASGDVDTSAGSVPMSPQADMLLPANLLGDEFADDLAEEQMDTITHQSSSEGPRTRFSSIGHANPLAENRGEDRASPRSTSSRSASIFLSPRESLNNLADADVRSTHSGHVSLDNPGPPGGFPATSRNFVSGIFGFNRQRGKTMADESPTLGTLKAGESQSFPRNLGDSLDPVTRRRRLSYGGNWAAPVTNLFPRNGLGGDDKVNGMSRLSSSRRGFPSLFSSSRLNPANLPVFGKQPVFSSGYDQFGPRNESTEFSTGANRGDASTSRPSSVYSFDRFPRPSTDSQPFGWGAVDRSNLRGSPLGPDWSTSRLWSRSHSRRQSPTYASTSNISLPESSEDVYEVAKGPSRPLQAPIGTRPASSQHAATPKLNPAAPSFTTLFARTRDRPKDKLRGKEVEGVKATSNLDNQQHDASPPESRKSKDSRSVITAGSLTESRESLERTPSGTPSGTPPSKETFIQKITRKSSSNKFNAWKEKGGLFYRKDDPSTAGEIDEDASSDAPLGHSLESTSTTPSGEKESHKDRDRDRDRGAKSKASWSFMRKSKRGEKSDLAASEVSESSERASETGDEDGHDRQAVAS